MSGEKKPGSQMKSPIEWIMRASLMLLGTAIALNVAITLLRPALPWLVGALALVATAWVVVAMVRWRRSRW